MADKWAQYAEPAAAAPPPAGADKWAQYAEPPADKPGYFSQVGTGIWNAVKGLAEVGNAGFHLATDNNPLTAVDHLRTLKKLIVDPQVDQAIQAADKWKAGDHSEAVGHALASIIPGAGPAAANIGEKLGSGDLTGAAADATVLGGAMALPHVAGPVVEAGAKAGTFTGAAIKGAAPDVAKGAAMIGGGELLAKIPGMEWPARAGLQYPGVRQVVSGVKAGVQAGKAALAERAASAAEVQPPPVVRPTAAPAFQPAGLLGPGPIVTPPPADASFVRSVPAEYPQVEGAAPVANAPTPAAAPAADMATLDGLAQELNQTSFAKASPESQAMIRTLVPRLNQPIPAELNAPPPVGAPRTPYQAPEPAAPSKTLQQMIQDDLAARRATQPTERPLAPAATQATQAPVPAEVAPTGETQPVLEQAGRSGYTATGEVKSPQLRLQEKIGSARAKNAGELAKAFHDSGISLEDAKSIKLDDPVWKEISDSLGQKKRPSKETVEATLMELGRLSRK